jgi:hypothetical protein
LMVVFHDFYDHKIELDSKEWWGRQNSKI